MSVIFSGHIQRLYPANSTKLYRQLVLHTKTWQLNTLVSSQHNVHNLHCVSVAHFDPYKDKCCHPLILTPCRRQYASGQSQKKSAVDSYHHKDDGQISKARKVVETSKTVSYLGIILIGVGITGLMFFTIGKELFSSNSPNVIYADALKLCKLDDRVIDAIGEPIKGFGETSRRGWRKHVSHLEYEKDGNMFLRMKFYVQGRYRKGTVNVEMKKNENGVYNYRYLFVDLSGYPQLTIVIKDQR